MADLTLAANNGDIGGGEVMLLQMAQLSRDLGLSVHVVAPDASAVLDRARHLGFSGTGIGGRGRPAYLRGLRAWDARERTGLLWCHGLVPGLATAGHRRRVVELHQQPTGAARLAALAARAGRPRVVVPSEHMRSRLPGTTVVSNWTEDIAAVARRTRTGGPRVIGFIGRLSPTKGIVDLAQALAILQHRRPGAYRLFLAGETRFVPDRDRRRVEAALAPIAPLTERPGWMRREDFFSRVDLAVFPSVWGEPFGLVAAESMAAGTPFVITDDGALPEVAGADHPWIARPLDPTDLADTIERALASDPTSAVAVARRRWEEHFSPTSARRRLRSLFRELDVLPEDPKS